MDTATKPEPSHMDTDKANIDTAVEVLLSNKDGATQKADDVAIMEASSNDNNSGEYPSPQKYQMIQQLSPCKVQVVSTPANVTGSNVSELSANAIHECNTASVKSESQDECDERMDTDVSAANKPLTRSCRRGK